jgi:predicted phage-related endonuclease
VVTASDAGAAVGVGRYARFLESSLILNRAALPQHLWQVKTGKVERDKQGNEATAHGISLEAKVRTLYERLVGCHVLPSPFRLHHDPQWLIGAEPDGSSQVKFSLNLCRDSL